jgi:hypothetical protein
MGEPNEAANEIRSALQQFRPFPAGLSSEPDHAALRF